MITTTHTITVHGKGNTMKQMGQPKPTGTVMCGHTHTPEQPEQDKGV